MRDLRKYSRQTNTGLVAGTISLVFIVGLGLIYIFYGQSSAVTGLACLLVAFIPIILVILSLWVMEKIVKKANQD